MEERPAFPRIPRGIWISSITSESVAIIVNRLSDALKNHRIISIIGIAKNAGKTTVLNQIIKEHMNQAICVTSIGLDGEERDNITRQDKPRIRLYPGMYVMTAESCLNASTIEYQIHERTALRTALGRIVIAEVTKTGLVLVAGPTSKQQMRRALDLMGKYHPTRILIDGALFRKSIASADVADGVVFVTGASYDSDMKKVVTTTGHIIDQLRKEPVKIPKTYREKLHENIVLYREQDQTAREEHGRLIHQEERLVDMLQFEPSHVYLPGALTDRMVEVLLRNRHRMNEWSLIVQDASFLLASATKLEKLEQIGVKIGVLNPIDILFVAYNPTSPFGYAFDDSEFRALLREELGFDVINVVQDLR